MWLRIRAAVLERAGNKCERCGVENHAEGFRDARGLFWPTAGMESEVLAIEGVKVFRIVLTTAHLDHDPANNDDFIETGKVKPLDETNLLALCAQCHNRHDIAHRKKNAAETRGRNKRAADRARGQAFLDLGGDDEDS